MIEPLTAFLRGRSPLAEEEIVWSGDGLSLVQTRYTYALEEESTPPLKLVTSVRALLTRGDEIMVVRDPAGLHILPGGRLDPGEELLDALERELLEETGWSIHPAHARIALFRYHIQSPRPAGYRYPYPDFLQLIYLAKADEHIPEAMEVGGHEFDAEFRPRGEVAQLSLSRGEIALLTLLDWS